MFNSEDEAFRNRCLLYPFLRTTKCLQTVEKIPDSRFWAQLFHFIKFKIEKPSLTAGESWPPQEFEREQIKYKIVQHLREMCKTNVKGNDDTLQQMLSDVNIDFERKSLRNRYLETLTHRSGNCEETCKKYIKLAIDNSALDQFVELNAQKKWPDRSKDEGFHCKIVRHNIATDQNEIILWNDSNVDQEYVDNAKLHLYELSKLSDETKMWCETYTDKSSSTKAKLAAIINSITLAYFDHYQRVKQNEKLPQRKRRAPEDYDDNYQDFKRGIQATSTPIPAKIRRTEEHTGDRTSDPINITDESEKNQTQEEPIPVAEINEKKDKGKRTVRKARRIWQRIVSDSSSSEEEQKKKEETNEMDTEDELNTTLLAEIEEMEQQNEKKGDDIWEAHREWLKNYYQQQETMLQMGGDYTSHRDMMNDINRRPIQENLGLPWGTQHPTDQELTRWIYWQPFPEENEQMNTQCKLDIVADHVENPCPRLILAITDGIIEDRICEGQCG